MNTSLRTELVRAALVAPGWALLALWLLEGTPVPPIRLVLEVGQPVTEQVQQNLQAPTDVKWVAPQ